MDVGEMKQRTGQLTDQLLELACAVHDLLSGPDTEAKREQLRAICSSIRQLEKRDVPVPDDLRRIKTDLTASLAVVDEAQVVKDLLQKQLLDVLEMLGISVGSSSGSRSGDRRRVTLADLMQAGVLQDGTRIVHRTKRSGHVNHGYIRSPGVVELTIDGAKKKFDTPSAAGQAFTGGSTDGWVYWAVVSDNGEDVPLKNYRERFLKEANA